MKNDEVQAVSRRGFSRRFLGAVAAFLVWERAGAQLPVQWQADFGGSGLEVLTSLQPTSDGGYWLGGYSASGISGNKASASFGSQDFWLVKVNSSGIKQWEKTFGGINDDYLNTMSPTSDGGLVLGGTSNSGASGNKTTTSLANDYWLVKVSASGDKQWEQVFGGTGNDYLYSVLPTSDGGFLLGGASASFAGTGNKTNASFGGFDYWLVKTDSTGSKIWEKDFGGANDDVLLAMVPAGDGGFVAGGYSLSPVSGNKSSANFGGADFWAVKVDANGIKQWEKTFGGTNDDVLATIQPTSDGGFLLGGYSFSGPSGNKTSVNFGFADYWLIKVDGSGNKQWEQSSGGTNNDYLTSIRPTSDGGCLLGGYSYSPASGSKTSANYGLEDYWLVKVNSSGIKQWEQICGGSGFDDLNTLLPTSDGGFLLGGSSASPVSGNKTNTNFGDGDFWIIKLGQETAAAPPRLAIARSGANVTISWPSPSTGFALEATSSLAAPNWASIGGEPNDDGATKSVTLPINTGVAFYRLKKL